MRPPAPSLSATLSMRWKFSAEPTPRPPEMTTRAAVSSGRSLLVISASRKVEVPGSSAGVTASTGALPPSAGTGSNEAARTVMTLFESADFTVASALQIGRTKVSAVTTPAMSEIICASSSAAARGITFLPAAEAGANRCEYSGASSTSSAATGSASPCTYCSASECSTLASPGNFAATCATSAAPSTSR
jgi:hypothetical protein